MISRELVICESILSKRKLQGTAHDTAEHVISFFHLLTIKLIHQVKISSKLTTQEFKTHVILETTKENSFSFTKPTKRFVMAGNTTCKINYLV